MHELISNQLPKSYSGLVAGLEFEEDTLASILSKTFSGFVFSKNRLWRRGSILIYIIYIY